MKKINYIWLILFLVLHLCFSVSIFAETIILKSGKTVEGKILEKTDKYVKIDFEGVPLTYFIDDIESIKVQRDSTPEDKTITETKSSRANEMSFQGIMLIKEGKLDEGLDLMKQAIKITPEDPGLHMNYGSMLFTKGQNVFESGNSQEGKAIFKEVEQELSLAIQLFKESDNILKSQCSFLLGDMYFYFYNDKEKAKNLYKKALEYYPEHGGAIDALKKFDGSGYAQDRANKLQPHFDNRKWVLGYQGSIDTASLMEYVIEGETVENWSELVTVASQKQTTPEEFMKTTKERIARLCPTIEWKVLSKSDKEIMYECMITNCPGQDNQHEIARIISGENGIHRMHYVTKKVPITSEKREEWIGLLKMFAQSENLSK